MSLPSRGAADRPDGRPRVLVNATGSRSGGGRTWVNGITRELQRGGDRGIDWLFILQPDMAEVIEHESAGVAVTSKPAPSPVSRAIWEQLVLPRLGGSVDVLISAANFGPLLRTRGHILLARNAIYFTDLRFRGRRGARLRVETALARASAARATVTVTASETMAELVRPHTRRPVRVIRFGPGLVGRWRPSSGDRFIFLHRTEWSPHKRLLDLLLAIAELARDHPRQFVVRSACDPHSALALSFHESRAEREVLADPVVADHIEFKAFGLAEQAVLDGDAVVMPSTIESFCFPLAEAVPLGIPIVAADTAFARELCGEGAIYVEPGAPAGLADGMRRILHGERPPEAPLSLREQISWAAHADGLASLCQELALRA